MAEIDEKTSSIAAFHRLVAEKTGLRIREQDADQLMNAVLARKKANGCASLGDYYLLLEADDERSETEQRELRLLLTVGESYFFRDKGQFELLRNRILPGLIRLREEEKRLRVWSAGCSTGEEPYSLAILIDELLGSHNGWEIFILGTDIRQDFLEKAGAGLYGKWSLRAVGEDIVGKYFKRHRGLHELDRRIRDMVTFRQGDILKDDYPGSKGDLRNMDLIVCRNVFIYYGRNAVSKILSKLADTLAEGGYLMTGHAELYSITEHNLKAEIYPGSVVYRRFPTDERETSWDNSRKDQQPAFAAQPPATVLVEQSRNIAQARLRRAEGAVSPKDELSEARALFSKGRYRETAAAADSMLSRDSRSYGALCIAASAYANLGEHAKAKEYLSRAIQADRSAAAPFYLLAQITEENGETEEAKEALKKAIYLEPSFVPAYLDLAAIYESQGETGKARRMRLSAIAILGTYPAHGKIEHYGDITAGELASRLKKIAGEEPR